MLVVLLISVYEVLLGAGDTGDTGLRSTSSVDLAKTTP